LEFVFTRKNQTFTRKLSDLHDFLEDPHFHELIFPKNHRQIQINLKCFKDNVKRLPRDWDDYRAEDRHGNPECFQEEYLQAEKNYGISNPNQASRHKLQLDGLKQRIEHALTRFDQRWKKNITLS
jgi:hypothetical protein